MDVTPYLLSGEIRRGRFRELERYDASRATFRLENLDRRFDPSYASSPYYPSVIPMRKVRLSATLGATTYRVYTGFIERFPQNWFLPNWNEVEIQCVCALDLLARASLGAVSWSQEASGTRVGHVLDAVGVAAGDRTLDTGLETVQASTFALADNKAALAHIEECTTTEPGDFFMAADGKATFQDRQHRIKAPFSTSQATFDDLAPAGGTLFYEGLVPSHDKDLLKNDVRVTRAGGTTQNASDTTSKNSYGTMTHSRSTLHATDAGAADQASFLLSQYKDIALRFAEMAVNPLADDAHWTQVLARELGDRITVIRRPPGGGTITQDCNIESIEHSIEPDRWLTTWGLSPADTNAYLVLDDATTGKLDSYKLAY